MTSKVIRCAVDETVLLVMSMSRWFALAPVRFTKSADKTFMYISRTFVIYRLVFFVVVDFLIIYATYLDVSSTISTGINKINDTEHTNFVLKMCDFIVSTGLVSVGIITATRKTKTSMYCVEAVRKIKNNILGHQEDALKWKIFSLTLVFLLGTWILKIVHIKTYYDFTDLEEDMQILALSILLMMELQFVVIALCIKSGFQAVNESLRNVISNLEQENPRNYNKPDFLKIHIKTINTAIDLIGMTDQRFPDVILQKRLKLSHKVREISQSFVGVCDVLREFNDSESTTMFLQLTILTLHIIVTIFNLVKSVHVHDNVFVDLHLMALQFVWFVYHVSKMILLVEPCCRTEQEVAETRILVGKLISQVTSDADPLQDEIEAFYNHILLNEVSYTAFGICSLGRPLISKLIGGVTTILVLFF